MSAVRWRRADRHRSSWHILQPDATKTICGRQPPPGRAEYLPEWPGNARTCETCAVRALKAQRR